MKLLTVLTILLGTTNTASAESIYHCRGSNGQFVKCGGYSASIPHPIALNCTVKNRQDTKNNNPKVEITNVGLIKFDLNSGLNKFDYLKSYEEIGNSNIFKDHKNRPHRVWIATSVDRYTGRLKIEVEHRNYSSITDTQVVYTVTGHCVKSKRTPIF